MLKAVVSQIAGAIATIINTANIWTKAQGTILTQLTDAATIAIDLSASNAYEVQLGGNRTLGVPTGLANAVRTGTINILQDGTGSRTIAFAWPYQFVGGTAPTLSTGKYVFDQLNYILNHYLTSIVTMTIAAPGVITWAAHGLKSRNILQLTTTGALPTGLSTNTTYWANVVNANTLNLSSSLANLQAGIFITTSGSQSGVHTATSISIGITANLAWA